MSRYRLRVNNRMSLQSEITKRYSYSKDSKRLYSLASVEIIHQWDTFASRMSSIHALEEKHKKKVPYVGPVLNYRAACLYQEDADLLLPGKWFNDVILVFWSEYMAHEDYFERTDLCFMHPGAIFLILLEDDDDERAELLKSLNIGDRETIFMPIHDSKEGEETNEAGSHWSLLVWNKRDMQFYHYDSQPDRNRATARKVGERIWAVIRKTYLFAEPPPMPPIFECYVPPQANEADCGVYVMFITNLLSLTGSILKDLDNIATPNTIVQFRSYMWKTYERLKEEYDQIFRGKTNLAKEVDVVKLKIAATVAPGDEGPAPIDFPERIEQIIRKQGKSKSSKVKEALAAIEARKRAIMGAKKK